MNGHPYLGIALVAIGTGAVIFETLKSQFLACAYSASVFLIFGTMQLAIEYFIV